MASRYEVQVAINSAKDLKNINWRHGPNRPYAVVWVNPDNKASTKVDEYGDTSPHWDQTLVLPLPAGPIEDFTLYIDVVHAVSQDEDTKPLIGSAKLKLSDVLDDVGFGETASRPLKLKRPSGRPQGKVDVEVKIREPGYRAPDAHYTPAYGVPPPTASRDYYQTQPPYSGPYSAAPQYGYQYGAPPPTYASQPSYGYGQSEPVYGHEEKKSSKFGGMGTGLAVGAVAGVLGGIALAEGADYVEDKIADDVAEKVEEDLGYDEGDDF